MSETGFYAMGTYGTEPGRVAAIARHVPDAVVYVRGRRNIRDLFNYHGIPTVVPTCPQGCPGLGRAEIERWMIERAPDRLVMDAAPYGVIWDELQRYIRTRRHSTFFLQRHAEPARPFETRDFKSILKAEPCPGPGEELHPLLCFEPHELPTRVESRQLLGASDRPMVLVIGRGTTPKFLEPVLRHCEARGFDHVVVEKWPVMPLMVGADLVVGYAGYSQIEAHALGVPMIAFANHADSSQHWRANATRELLESTMAELDVRHDKGRAGFVNRARRAAALVCGDPAWRNVDG